MIKTFTKLQHFPFSTRGGLWATAQPHRPEAGKQKSVTLIPGIGIGP